MNNDMHKNEHRIIPFREIHIPSRHFYRTGRIVLEGTEFGQLKEVPYQKRILKTILGDSEVDKRNISYPL